MYFYLGILVLCIWIISKCIPCHWPMTHIFPLFMVSIFLFRIISNFFIALSVSLTFLLLISLTNKVYCIQNCLECTCKDQFPKLFDLAYNILYKFSPLTPAPPSYLNPNYLSLLHALFPLDHYSSALTFNWPILPPSIIHLQNSGLPLSRVLVHAHLYLTLW